MNPTPFSNQKALVSGSTQGIGRAIAEELARQGATVTLLARNATTLRKTAATLPTPTSQEHDYLVADFTQPDQVASCVAAYLEAHPAGFHVLINNTGGPPGGPILQASISEFRAAFEQHVVCNHLLAQAVVPAMQARQYGRIVNIISTSVKVPLPGLGVSNTIRAAVANWAKTLANELAADGITINNVLPGMTQTQRLESLLEKQAATADKQLSEVETAAKQQIPARRFGEADEIAAAAVFFASPAAGYVTGTNLAVDGGRTGSL